MASGHVPVALRRVALQDICTFQAIGKARRTRKTAETLQADSAAIDADRAAVEELKKQLDNSEAKAISERYEAIKAELDEMKKEDDELYAIRSQLFEERRAKIAATRDRRPLLRTTRVNFAVPRD